MIPQPHTQLTCIAEKCRATLALGAKPANDLWRAGQRGWGVVLDVVLCPEHAGRTREKRPRLMAPLEGDQHLFDLPDTATVPKRRGRKKTVN